jgi:hypothetical protein
MCDPPKKTPDKLFKKMGGLCDSVQACHVGQGDNRYTQEDVPTALIQAAVLSNSLGIIHCQRKSASRLQPIFCSWHAFACCGGLCCGARPNCWSAHAEALAMTKDGRRNGKSKIHLFRFSMPVGGLELERKAELKAEHEGYLRAHPEVPQLLNDFVSSCLVQQPNDVFEFAREYFSTVQPRTSRGGAQ